MAGAWASHGRHQRDAWPKLGKLADLSPEAARPRSAKARTSPERGGTPCLASASVTASSRQAALITESEGGGLSREATGLVPSSPKRNASDRLRDLSLRRKPRGDNAVEMSEIP